MFRDSLHFSYDFLLQHQHKNHEQSMVYYDNRAESGDNFSLILPCQI